jgi:hypothetical protein
MFRYLILLIILIFASCSPKLSVFSYDTYRSGNWTENDLKKIQFYVSNDITLRRKISNASSKIESGKIRIIDGSQYEEIVIKANTPGVYVFSPDKDRLAISFEVDKYLVFGPKDRNGEYVLLATKWEKDYGIVKYGNSSYDTPASSAFSYLMVDTKYVNKTSAKRRVAKGREVRS